MKGLDHADNFGVGKTLDCPVKREQKLFIQKLVLQMISKGFLHEVFRMKQQQAEGQSFKGNFYMEHGNLGEFYKLDSFSQPRSINLVVFMHEAIPGITTLYPG